MSNLHWLSQLLSPLSPSPFLSSSFFLIFFRGRIYIISSASWRASVGLLWTRNSTAGLHSRQIPDRRLGTWSSFVLHPSEGLLDWKPLITLLWFSNCQSSEASETTEHWIQREIRGHLSQRVVFGQDKGSKTECRRGSKSEFTIWCHRLRLK